MKIGILMQRHPLTRISPIMPEVIRLLRKWKVTVDLIYPEEQLINLTSISVKHDFYVLKSDTDLSLSLAGALHAAGAVILNPYPVAAMLRNKIIATQKLKAAGVPVPETYVASSLKELAPLLNEGPLVIKPYRGYDGIGVQFVRDVDELDKISFNHEPIFAQRFYKPQGKDKKIYCMGGQIFGVKRVWPARTYEQKLGEPYTISPKLRKIALQCSKEFGIELFGFDVIFNDDQPYVVDISPFPGFKGVPNAALRIADYIYHFGQDLLSKELEPIAAKEVQT